MKKISLNGLDLDVYTETLNNGLDIIFIPMPDKKNYHMSYATRFGSDTTRFIPAGEDKEIKVPDGIAHFLEHKMFEQEDGVDPFSFFSESGTGSNAFTSFDRTHYICYGTQNFNNNLRFLLNFVNSPYYTDENVEKEKGIIAEEAKMYSDMPEWELDTKIREGIYKNNPRRVEIAGSIPEIMKMTKEDLYTCYNSFYSPNNMFLLVVGNFDKDEALKIVHECCDNIENKGAAVKAKYDEPEEINIKESTIYANVKVPKVGIGLKIPTDKFSEYDDIVLDLYLEMITTICFGSSSIFRERVRNKKLLNSIYTDWETVDGFRDLILVATTEHPDELLEEIKNEFNNLDISLENLTRMKKVWIANEVKMSDYVDSVVNNIGDDLIRYKKIIPNKVDIIRNMDIDTLNKIVKDIDFTNICVVKYLCKEEK